MVTLPPEWEQWVKENVVRGVEDRDLIAILLEHQFNKTLAVKTVLEIASCHHGTVPNYELYTDVLQEHAESRQKTITSHFPDEGIGKPWSVLMAKEDPQIRIYHNVLSHDECDHLIALSKPKLQRNTTIDNDTGEAVIHRDRTSQGTFFSVHETPFIAMLDDRIAEIMNLPVENGEGMQILNYQVGGEYKPHYDYFAPQEKGSHIHIRNGGQRVATLVMYLNDVEAGGETSFPELNLKAVPLKGSALYFSYFFNNNNTPDPRSLHAGCPVVKGEKWIAVKWVRESKFS
jgi:prolyl 4-hydroxylase